MHNIRALERCIVKDHWRILPQHLRKAVKKEIMQMLEADIIGVKKPVEKSASDSPKDRRHYLGMRRF